MSVTSRKRSLSVSETNLAVRSPFRASVRFFTQIGESQDFDWLSSWASATPIAKRLRDTEYVSDAEDSSAASSASSSPGSSDDDSAGSPHLSRPHSLECSTTVDDLYSQHYDLLNKVTASQMSAFDFTTARQNVMRNRYQNILAFERTRVKLRNADNDYINANYVGLADVPSRYIGTQSPLPHTIDDFWAMAIDNKSPVVVCLTRFEFGRACVYFPAVGQSHRYGRVNVTTRSSVQYGRDLTVRFILIQREIDQQPHGVIHLYYTGWPDFGVPSAHDPIFRLLSIMKAFQRRLAVVGETGPPIVHCSAGVGRAGTFLAAALLIEKAQMAHNNSNSGNDDESSASSSVNLQTRLVRALSTPPLLRGSSGSDDMSLSSSVSSGALPHDVDVFRTLNDCEPLVDRFMSGVDELAALLQRRTDSDSESESAFPLVSSSTHIVRAVSYSSAATLLLDSDDMSDDAAPKPPRNNNNNNNQQNGGAPPPLARTKNTAQLLNTNTNNNSHMNNAKARLDKGRSMPNQRARLCKSNGPLDNSTASYDVAQATEIFQSVLEMRKQRYGLVQTQAQYLLVCALVRRAAAKLNVKRRTSEMELV